MEVNRHFDVAIVGGGPAGTSAAISLARSGARVLLVEAGSFPRQKVCGEFVSSESLSLLADLLSTAGEERLLSQAVRIGSTRLFIDSSSTTAPIVPSAASIPRLLLDHALWRAADTAGVTCLEDSPALRVEQQVEPMRILLDRGHHYTARFIIDASGRWSRLHASEQARALNAPGPKWLGLKAHYREHAAPPSVDLYFFEGGYCGVQPVSVDEINVCAMVRSDRARTLEQVFTLHPGLRQRAHAWERQGDPVSTSPLLFRPRHPVDRSVLNVGDAAGFIDPFVGDGIAMALRTGKLAADVLARCLAQQESSADAAREYERLYRRTFESTFRNAERMRSLLELPRPLRALTMRALKYPPIASYVVRKTRGHLEPTHLR